MPGAAPAPPPPAADPGTPFAAAAFLRSWTALCRVGAQLFGGGRRDGRVHADDLFVAVALYKSMLHKEGRLGPGGSSGAAAAVTSAVSHAYLASLSRHRGKDRAAIVGVLAVCAEVREQKPATVAHLLERLVLSVAPPLSAAAVAFANAAIRARVGFSSAELR